MNNEELQAKVDKLPKWARAHIGNLRRRTENAETALQTWSDNQTKSNVSTTEFTSTGDRPGPEIYTRYFQTDQVEFVHEGVRLRVSVRREGQINLAWESENRECGQVCFQPTGFGQADLVAKENMR